MHLNLHGAKDVKTAIKLAALAKSHVITEEQAWHSRLEELRKHCSPRDIAVRLARLGANHVKERFELLDYPPTPEDRTKISRTGDTERDSRACRMIKQLSDPHLVAALSRAAEEIERRDRLRAYVQFWELLGVHPDAVPNRSVFGLMARLAWTSVISRSAAREMGQQAKERAEQDAMNHYAVKEGAAWRVGLTAIEMLCNLAKNGNEGSIYGLDGAGEHSAQSYERLREGILEFIAKAIAELDAEEP